MPFNKTVMTWVAVLVVGLVSLPGLAKKKNEPKPITEPPMVEGIAEMMEGLAWGTKATDIMKAFETKIRESYKEKLKAAQGNAIQEDGIRTKMMAELDKLKKSYVEFNGTRTGFESSLIASEFTHNNKESMLMWDAGKYVEYMFFINGKFWERFRAFRKDSFKSDIDFDTYLATLENRLGLGFKMVNDMGAFIKEQWQDDQTLLTAEDKSGFYGAYCLIFQEKATVANLAKLRVNKGLDDGKVKSDYADAVEAAISGNTTDSQGSVIDGYTGNAPAAAPPADDKGKGKGKGKGKTEATAPAQGGTPEQPANKPAGKDLVDDLF